MKAFYVLVACCVIPVVASVSPLICPDGGSPGPSCTKYKPCKSGYMCLNGICCPSTKCKSGVVGPVCSITQPCKPGYNCIGGRCCRGCPTGWTEGPSCNTVQGMHKCPGNFQCVHGTCCRPPIVRGTCPKITPIPQEHCLFWKPGGPMCDSDKNCDFGLLCCPDLCNWRTCKIPVMNKGR